MRLQRQHRRRLAGGLGAPHRKLDHRAMAAMHAVEIADRQDRRTQGRDLGAVIAGDDKADSGALAGSDMTDEQIEWV